MKFKLKTKKTTTKKPIAVAITLTGGEYNVKNQNAWVWVQMSVFTTTS